MCVCVWKGKWGRVEGIEWAKNLSVVISTEVGIQREQWIVTFHSNTIKFFKTSIFEFWIYMGVCLYMNIYIFEMLKGKYRNGGRKWQDVSIWKTTYYALKGGIQNSRQ